MIESSRNRLLRGAERGMNNHELANKIIQKHAHQFAHEEPEPIPAPDDEDMEYLVHLLEQSDTPDATMVALVKSPGFNMSVLEENGYLDIDTFYDGGSMDTPNYPQITRVLVTQQGFEAAIEYLTATDRKETS